MRERRRAHPGVGWSVLLTALAMIASTSAQCDDLRDPFMFGPRADATSQAGQVLVGILWDATHPLAMIGDDAVGVGDMIGAWRVIAIQPGGVTVAHGDRQAFVSPGQAIPNE